MPDDLLKLFQDWAQKHGGWIKAEYSGNTHLWFVSAMFLASGSLGDEWRDTSYSRHKLEDALRQLAQRLESDPELTA